MFFFYQDCLYLTTDMFMYDIYEFPDSSVIDVYSNLHFILALLDELKWSSIKFKKMSTVCSMGKYSWFVRII